MARKFYYGGQAVIEGVMMRGQRHFAVAVRQPSGNIAVEVQSLADLYKGRWRQVPIIRGIIVLIESLAMGTQVLFRSAQLAMIEEEEEMPPALLWGAVAGGLILAIGGFFVLPMLITRYVLMPFIESNIVAAILEGLIRVGLFVAYLAVIGRLKDIRRVFAYHGAEHKTVNAFEGGQPLEVEPVQNFSTAHTRCGTSFILTVLVLAIIVFVFIGQPGLGYAILWRIVLIPVIAAVSYEFVRFGGAHSHNRFVHAILTPGLWLQSMTTRPPDDSQIEVAITSLKAVIRSDSGETAASPVPAPPDSISPPPTDTTA